jgi:hypothetical protein
MTEYLLFAVVAVTFIYYADGSLDGMSFGAADKDG